MHLLDDVLMAVALEGVAPAAEDAAHLAACGECRARLDWWRQTAQELDIARASTPSAEALARYAALFEHVQQSPTGLWQRAAGWVATLVWDSRTRPGTAGVRSAVAAGYRLLYAAATREVELWVGPGNGACVVEGEWMPDDEAAPHAAALVELTPVGARAGGQAVEAGEDGRFRLEGVRTGIYQLTLTPVHGEPLIIDRLEIG